jgi:hypothetical protein
MNPLREALCQKNSVELLRRSSSSWEAANGLRPQPVPRVAEVMRRVEVAAGDERARLWPVKLAALVHEIPPTELGATLRRAGVADVASRVLSIIHGFGHVWRVKDGEGRQKYVRRHRAYLEGLRLFEVAHEGAATEAMRAVARLGGLEERLGEWGARIAAAHSRSCDYSSTGGGA